MGQHHDVIEQLVDDHRVMRRLLDWIDAESDPVPLRQAFIELAALLAQHEAVEQQVLFPALGSEAGPADDRLGEHEEVNQLLDEMRGLRTASFGFLKRATSVVVQLRDHFEHEEEELFPVLRALLSDEELAALAGPALAARRAAPAFPLVVPA